MKKNSNSKAYTIISIVLMLVLMVTYFLPYWKYTGFVEDDMTGEKRVEAMKNSISGYTWFPNSNESNNLEVYFQDPTVKYSEEVISTDAYDSVMKDAEDKLAAANLAVEEAKAAVATAEAAEEEAKAAAEAVKDSADEAVAKAAADAYKEAGKVTKSAKKDLQNAEKDAAKLVGVEDLTIEASNVLVKIRKDSKPANEITEADKLAKETYKNMKVNEISDDVAQTFAIAFALLLLVIAMAILVRKKMLVVSVVSFGTALYNLLVFISKPALQLSTSFALFRTIRIVVLAVAAVVLVINILAFINEQKAKNVAEKA